MKLNLMFIALISLFLSACSDDLIKNNIDNSEFVGNADELVGLDTEKHLVEFAKVLSKVVHERKDVREFLKNESLKQFDKNYDVLYCLVKDENVSEQSFRDILISYSSLETIEEIETNVPLLNILVPEITFFDVHPKNLNIEDKEIPVVVSKKLETSLYLNGKEKISIEKGEIPDFHVFVVNENSRVIIPDNHTQSLKSGDSKFIMFKSPNFDASLKSCEESTLKSVIADFSTVGQKAIDAFQYFNKDDGSISQKALQRDYVYYGITPQNQIGSLNKSVSEFISFIEVNPNSYFKISDQNIPNTTNNDPRISHNTTSKEKRQLSEAELIDRLWTKGAYDFRFEIMTSTEEQAQIVYIPLRPEQIWNFNIDRSYKHSTWIRHSKNTYTINVNKFTAKRVFLDKMVSLGKWDISEEALFRYVKIYEEDESAETDETETYEMTSALKINFNGNGKTGVGLKVVNTESGWSTGIESTTTEKVSKSFTIKRKLDSDPLGGAKIYFYDPLIENISPSGSECSMHTYNTGTIDFGIVVK